MNPAETSRAGTRAYREAVRALSAAPPASPARRPLKAFRWLDFRPLWESRNDQVASLFGDPTNALRERWLAHLGLQPATQHNLAIEGFAGRDRMACAIVGDPGEGDFSQQALVEPLKAIQPDCDFMLICSDVIYPAGDVNEYVEKFYEPYKDWLKPIYALPGNHDWYDELEGFMFHFCGTDPPPRDTSNPDRPFLWRSPRAVKAAARQRRDTRPPSRGGYQPAPYFTIDTGPVVLVCIDTGILGDLDHDQGAWLARVSHEIEKPKVLVTGRPLIVNGNYQPGPIARYPRTVDDIVREPQHGYVAAIGGDLHNYQRYPYQLPDGRTFEYVVNGGGGAFMHATHRIPRVDLGPAQEPDVRLFPLRGDSLQYYSRVVVKGLDRLVWLSRLLPLAVLLVAVLLGLLLTLGFGISHWIWTTVALLFALPFIATLVLFVQVIQSGVSDVRRLSGTRLTSAQASRWMSEQSPAPAPPAIPEPAELGPDETALAEFVHPRVRRSRGFVHSFFSEAFDADEAPLLKQFVRLDADLTTLWITCCAVIGNEQPGHSPYVEEWVAVPLEPARAAMATARAQAAPSP